MLPGLVTDAQQQNVWCCAMCSRHGMHTAACSVADPPVGALCRVDEHRAVLGSARQLLNHGVDGRAGVGLGVDACCVVGRARRRSFHDRCNIVRQPGGGAEAAAQLQACVWQLAGAAGKILAHSQALLPPAADRQGRHQPKLPSKSKGQTPAHMGMHTCGHLLLGRRQQKRPRWRTAAPPSRRRWPRRRRRRR